MACGDCGGFAFPDRNAGGQNPLDSCQQKDCNNPCNTVIANSAQSESLPSQIDNFTTAFFGAVVKTELNGVVTWSLPCSLDVGLPSNPRGATEPLACYFLRLFNNGIKGIPGDPGVPGANGLNGANAYTTVAQPFVQPTLNTPFVTVLTVFNPALVAGLGVFIDGSGWYQINGTDGAGNLFLTFLQAASNPFPGTVPAGVLVVPSGFTGIGVQGPQGPVGPQGPQGPQGLQGLQGPPGTAITSNNGQFSAVGSDFATVSQTYVQVTIGASPAQVTLPTSGTYLILAMMPLYLANLAGGASSTAFMSLFDTVSAVIVPSTEQNLTMSFNNVQYLLTAQAIYSTTGPNHVIQLQVKLPAPQNGATLKIGAAASVRLTFVQVA